MKQTLTALTLASFAFAAPAFAQDAGDAEAGAKVFNKCQTCHVVADADGNVLAGKGGRIGPNLYGVVGRVAGSYPDFRYGKGIEELMATGYVWTEADVATYTQDPTKFLAEKTGDKKAKSSMAFKLGNAKDSANVAAYLVSLAPPVEPAEGEGAPAAATN
jgi:cytochrome c